MVAGICSALALIHLTIWLQRRKVLSHLFFSLAATGAAVNVLIDLFVLTARDIDSFGFWFGLQNYAIGLIIVSLVWFVYVDFGTARRWLAITISAIWIISLLLNAGSPYSLVYKSITEIHQVPLPWGEFFSSPVGEVNVWKYIADFASLLFILYLADASIRLWQKGNRKHALMVGGSVIFFITVAGIHTPLVDEGIIQTPPVISFSFLAIVIAISIGLAGAVIRSSLLSQTVTENERRWRSLLEGVQLIVVGLKPDGTINYVNPFFEKLTGYGTKEVLGRSWFDKFIPEAAQESLKEVLLTTLERNPKPHYPIPLLTRDGSVRELVWSNFQLKDESGNPAEDLIIGADVTDREEAFREIQELKNRLQEENIYLREEIAVRGTHRDILGSSDAIRYALGRVEQVAQTETSILLEGETGTGKELFARAIHEASGRRDLPMVRVDCAAIPPSLIESELFGHEKGAFTGADRERKGRFELANGGTVFLDEIGELPLQVQPKLLRVLEEGEFERVGGSETIRVDVRLIASTNRVLIEEVEAGRFREDLYYRLSAFPISIPPLRKRKEDIPLIVQLFVERFCRRMGKQIDQIPPQTLEKLEAYSWPGNVRELRNVVERAVIATNGSILTIVDDLQQGAPTKKSDSERRRLSDVEREHILRVLKECNWRIEGEAGAATILGLHPNTLRNRLNKLGIKRPA